mmetsp:Transcript_33972/g.79536  ORF Transcript_33972/g.79536 Transcript_33972/m.79536 type:complete len:85 (-) Transcript_33972:377-631(-)
MAGDAQGALVVSVCAGATVTLKSVHAINEGWHLVELKEGEEAPEHLAIRGYKLHKRGQRELVFDKPGEYVVDDDNGWYQRCNLL